MATKQSALSKKALDKPVHSGIWRPEADGDVIEGVVASMGQAQGKFGPQTTVTLKINGGAGYAMVYANDCLKRELLESKVTEGDKIAIAFRGTQKTGKGRPFKLFTVAKA